MATHAISTLSQALKKSGGGAVNPDVFKPHLRSNERGKLSSAQVHAESCILSDRLEDKLRPLKAPNGDPLSILVDKRLAQASIIEHYAAMAKDTERKVVLCDVDAPLEKSLMGVLERHPDGADPLPPYHAIGDGFSSVRSNRAAVIDKFIANPDLGSYQLYGTAFSGEKVKVATVEQGELTIEEPDMYADLITCPGDVSARLSETLIDVPLIDTLTKNLDSERADIARSALGKHIGKTWLEALDAHSAMSE